MKKFLQKLFGFSVGPVIGSIISLITIPVTTYFIIPEEYGKVTMFTLLYSIIEMTVALGIEQSYSRFYHEEPNKKKLLFNSMFLPMNLVLIIIAILIIYAPTISNILFSSEEYTIIIYLLAVMVPLLIFDKFLMLYVRMQEKAVMYSILSVVARFLALIITIIFVLFIRRDFSAIVYSTIIGQIISDIIIIFINRKIISFNIKLFDKELFKELIKFGLPLAIVSIIGWALNSMDKIFLRIYANFEEIGYYNIAMKISNTLLVIQSCFTSFWIPTAYRWYKENESKEKFNLVSDGVAFGMSILFIGILLFKNLIPIIVSKSYETSIYIMPFLLFYPIMYTMSETTTLGITFSKKSYFNIIVSVLSITVNLILNFILIPKFNAVGAAVATGIAYIIFFWTRTIISRKLWNKFEINKYIVLTILLLIDAMCNTLIKNILINTIINLISIIIVLFTYRNIVKYILDIIKQKKFKSKVHNV